ncbi:MAG: hypothetical protein LBQ98_05740 [Nitrososphaerota archaeon]|jgi:uncharacterized membrane protein YidH (DUF202 family)|nr:hypothetical protein [Nitrososphaerota archaeon]
MQKIREGLGKLDFALLRHFHTIRTGLSIGVAILSTGIAVLMLIKPQIFDATVQYIKNVHDRGSAGMIVLLVIGTIILTVLGYVELYKHLKKQIQNNHKQHHISNQNN